MNQSTKFLKIVLFIYLFIYFYFNKSSAWGVRLNGALSEKNVEKQLNLRNVIQMKGNRCTKQERWGPYIWLLWYFTILHNNQHPHSSITQVLGHFTGIRRIMGSKPVHRYLCSNGITSLPHGVFAKETNLVIPVIIFYYSSLCLIYRFSQA